MRRRPPAQGGRSSGRMQRAPGEAMAPLAQPRARSLLFRRRSPAGGSRPREPDRAAAEGSLSALRAGQLTRVMRGGGEGEEFTPRKSLICDVVCVASLGRCAHRSRASQTKDLRGEPSAPRRVAAARRGRDGDDDDGLEEDGPSHRISGPVFSGKTAIRVRVILLRAHYAPALRPAAIRVPPSSRWTPSSRSRGAARGPLDRPPACT